MKVTQGMKITAWCERFDTFQSYLPMCLWLAGAKQGEWPAEYDEFRKREILEFALSAAYLTALNNEGWCLQENTYDASIGKMVELEPEIYKRIEAQKVAAANTAAIKELQQKVGSKKSSGRGGSGTANGDSKVYKDCKTCGKRHPGVCWDLEKSDSKKRSRKYLTKDDAKQYMKMALAKHCKHDSDSSDSDSSVDSWRRGMSKAEQMHVLASSGNDPNDSDIEFDKSEIRRYRKQAKKWSAKSKRK